MDYVILILLIAVVVFLPIIVLKVYPTDKEIRIWEEIDNPDLARKKRDANFVWTDELTKFANSNEGDITNDV